MNPEEIQKLKGWDFHDPAKVRELKGREAQKAHDLDTLAYRVFATDDGKKFLKWMVQQTILRPTGGPNASERGAGIREGQNDIVLQINGMIERSKQGVKR